MYSYYKYFSLSFVILKCAFAVAINYKCCFHSLKNVKKFIEICITVVKTYFSNYILINALTFDKQLFDNQMCILKAYNTAEKYLAHVSYTLYQD